MAAPELADRFLYNLRYATIVDTRPTTRLDEILKVVRQTGIDEKRYLQHYRDSSAEAALDGDLTRMHALGIHADQPTDGRRGHRCHRGECQRNVAH